MEVDSDVSTQAVSLFGEEAAKVGVFTARRPTRKRKGAEGSSYLSIKAGYQSAIPSEFARVGGSLAGRLCGRTEKQMSILMGRR